MPMEDFEWFGEWVAYQRQEVYQYTQQECADRVQAYYDKIEADLPKEKRTTFHRATWAKIEGNRRWRRVRESTVLHVSKGLQIPLATCEAMAGYAPKEAIANPLSVRIGTRIREAIVLAHLTVQQVADGIGVPAGHLRSWQSGRTMPDVVQVHRLAKLLDVPLITLIDPEERTPLERGVSLERVMQEIQEVKELLVAVAGSSGVAGVAGVAAGSALSLLYS